MKRALAVLAILLVTGWVTGESEKDKITDYFEIELESNPRWGEGYNGWINYTETIRCKVNQTVDPEGLLILPYEQVDYVLGVKSLGDVIEPIGSTVLVMTPNCYATVRGRMMYWATPQDRNITLVHLFKPEHSHLPAKQYEVQTPIPAQYVYAQTGLTGVWQRFSGNPAALLAIGLAMLLGISSLFIFAIYNRPLGALTFFLALLLLAGGVFLAMSSSAPAHAVVPVMTPDIYTTETTLPDTTTTLPETTTTTKTMFVPLNVTG